MLFIVIMLNSSLIVDISREADKEITSKSNLIMLDLKTTGATVRIIKEN